MSSADEKALKCLFYFRVKNRFCGCDERLVGVDDGFPVFLLFLPLDGDDVIFGLAAVDVERRDFVGLLGCRGATTCSFGSGRSTHIMPKFK